MHDQIALAERWGFGLMMIIDKVIDKTIGMATVEQSPLEKPNHVELTIARLSSWEGHGFGLEVVPELVKWGCSMWKCDRIVGIVKRHNKKCLKMMRALPTEQIEDRKPIGDDPQHVFVLRPPRV